MHKGLLIKIKSNLNFRSSCTPCFFEKWNLQWCIYTCRWKYIWFVIKSLMKTQHLVLCLDKTDLLACESMWWIFTWVASKTFGNAFSSSLFKFPLPAAFCCLWAAQIQEPIKHHESEHSFQDFLAKNQQWRKSFAWVSSLWNIILSLWILKHKERGF